eukprot:136276-Prymnesium_polylepis.1
MTRAALMWSKKKHATRSKIVEPRLKGFCSQLITVELKSRRQSHCDHSTAATGVSRAAASQRVAPPLQRRPQATAVEAAAPRAGAQPVRRR